MSNETTTSPPAEPIPHLSVIVPAYNEAERLPGTLEAILAFLGTQDFTSELIVANDGSTDQTSRISHRFAGEHDCLRVLDLPHHGKAAAVRAGVNAARGRYILFSDADLSTPINYAWDLLFALESGADVAIGSREGAGSRRIGEPAYRHLMGRIFNTVVRTIAVPGINDTQCGFKSFRREAAAEIFSRVRLYASDRAVQGPRVTAFDVEVLFLARKLGMSIVEIPVTWTHAPGSKVSPFADSLRMVLDVLRVRWNALRGLYN
jgi:glycosyltransferase involved in cell wall biosynthesis